MRRRETAAAFARKGIAGAGVAIGRLEAKLATLVAKRDRLQHIKDVSDATKPPAEAAAEPVGPVEPPPIKPRKDGKARKAFERGLEDVYDAIRAALPKWFIDNESVYIDETGLVDLGAVGENYLAWTDKEDKLGWMSVFDAVAGVDGPASECPLPTASQISQRDEVERLMYRLVTTPGLVNELTVQSVLQETEATPPVIDAAYAFAPEAREVWEAMVSPKHAGKIWSHSVYDVWFMKDREKQAAVLAKLRKAVGL